MLMPLGASPTGGIGFEAVGELLAADSTGSLVRTIAARTAEASAG
jgi:hypothetical protein